MTTVTEKRRGWSGEVGLAVLILLAAAAPGELWAADAIRPGKITTRATWGCMGVNWHIAGDDNRNASVKVEYRRQGTRRWRPALPLWLHVYRKTTMFSGSVFRLAPGTGYEFRLSMKDPDGGGAVRTISAATLTYPRMPTKTVAVKTGGLAEAEKLASPGTGMLLGAGTYRGTRLTKPGRPGQWIVYRPAGDGKVVIEGEIRIEADYVWLDGLTIRSPKTGIRGSHKGVCITNCRIQAHYAIWTPGGAENYFIADNRLTGDAKGRFTFGGEGVDLGSSAGKCGHAVCFNDITDFADGISYGRGDIDIYNNYVHENVDDFIEPDYAHENYRLWNNRCYNSMCGFSFQPMKGGPWYMFNNINVGAYLHAFKVKSITGPTVIYGNSILTKSSRLGQSGDLLRGWILNNAWMRVTKGALGESGRFRPGPNPTRVDHNAYGTGGAEIFRKIRYAELARERGWDKHSVLVDYRNVLAERVAVPPGKPYYGRGIHGRLIGKDWHFGHQLLLPKPGSKLIDAGTVLPNLTGPFLGKAPDIGAHELGLGTAWYGPRTWDHQAGLIYGLPDGWRKARLSDAGRYASIGCPNAAGAKALLTGESGKLFALMRTEPAKGEGRWRRARQIVAPDAGAVTKVLEFQDGFYVRLYERNGNAALVAARVEPDGVLHVTVGCRKADLPAARLKMFQFVRSLYR